MRYESWLIAALTFSACLIGAWELVVTRTSSILFFYDIAYVVLAVCLFGIGVGAIAAGSVGRHWKPILFVGFLPVSILGSWWLLYLSELAWVSGLFALPFVVFGAASVAVWREVRDQAKRPFLYAFELVGAVAGLLLLGPLVISLSPIDVLGEIGVETHLKETVSREGLVRHYQQTNSYARTDIVQTRRSSVRYFFTDGMFVTRSVAWDGRSRSFSDPHVEELASLKRLAFRSSSLESIALLGVGAGFDIAVALQEGASQIDGVELNAVTIEQARKLDEWAGGVMHHPGVNLHIKDARRFMHLSEQRYDHVNLTLLQTSPASLRGRQHIDARVITTEALATYLDRLRPLGVLSIIQNTDRLARSTVVTVLGAGVDRSGLLHYRIAGENPFSHLLLVRNEPFKAEDIAALDVLAEDLGATRVSPSKTKMKGSPASDDRPYLFESGTEFGLQGFLLTTLVVLFVALWCWLKRNDTRQVRFVICAVLVGGCTFTYQVQVVYLCQFAIGNPTTSLAVALSAVLGGAGLGVLLFGRHLQQIGWRTTGVLAAVACLVAVFAGSPMMNQVMLFDHASQMAFLFFLFLSLPLGLPFLATINRASTDTLNGESLVIGFDGIGGILGAAGGTAIAVISGFSSLGIATVAGFLLFACVAR
ncbi:MAG: hypothetical protein HOC70_17250 [Gammaproteobacteria bacterium]|jgi:hypothetical protein|nr:hypothetical protein [Gammaproteobacteria bacterium]MBT4494992.1 hypothetical protein [Gammaproteobacteria bacterium]MBT7369509.1 hypothetical protein [Gammaproteobacteria bacterium]